jgi:tetratricopeptide (TPR) repeat protein
MRRLSLLFLLFVAVPAIADHDHATAPAQDDHSLCAMAPLYVPPELLERPVTLRKGVGNSHEKVTTKSPEAQAFYDQGLNYLESYVWIEASRSFHQALRLDPDLAMACLGLSRTHSGLDNPAEAKRWYERALALAPKASGWERARIAIRAKQLAALDSLEDQTLLAAYRKTIDDALANDPDNAELWLLRGNAEEPNASGRGQRGGASTIAFYERVLALQPDNASAHHYLIHTCETIGQIDQALAHGAKYARLAPAIPHAAHMWAHDLRRVGRLDEAIEQFKKAYALECAYYAAEKIDPGFDWHHGHNLDLLASCYQHKGQMALAEKTMRESGALGTKTPYLEFNRRELPNFLIHRGRWNDALTESRKLTESPFAQARSVGHALAGQALIGLGRMDEAAAELTAARSELERVPRVLPGTAPARGQVEPWIDALRAELLLRNGDRATGSALMTSVIRSLRAIKGPDAWSQALFRIETMARTARDVGDWELAGFAADQMVEHDGTYGGSHLAKALALKQKGDAPGAQRELELAKRGWKDADPDLPERALLAAR